ncbi:hypothetical protein [Candidatus Bealeia paramacronuclearis]
MEIPEAIALSCVIGQAASQSSLNLDQALDKFSGTFVSIDSSR